ncbi:MAG: hypothetical protein NC401_17830, partial [Ruminococcus sp.]|nr:hypothetical protein [Ruminococcus sp.]
HGVPVLKTLRVFNLAIFAKIALKAILFRAMRETRKNHRIYLLGKVPEVIMRFYGGYSPVG